MDLRTTLTKEEIIAYYQNAELFPYPKGDRRGVEFEVYFENDARKIESRYGFYYRDMKEQIRTVSTSPLHTTNTQVKQQEGEIKYVLQLTSGFDYFLNID